MIDYSCRELIIEAMFARMMRGYKIECYPSRYKFRKNMMNRFWLDNRNNCFKCGCSDNLEIDHIKPESKYPELALDENNVQLLCRSCNASKGNRNEIDYTPIPQTREEFFAELMESLNEK
mgnify:CR=1 FL=1